jgi:serine protease Do
MLQVTTVRDQVGGSVVRLGRGARRGSGIVVAQDRVVVLSHTLAGDQVQVGLDGESHAGAVSGADRTAGISLLTVPTGSLTPITWAESLPDVGDVVYALGDPGTGLRVTEGRVSAAPLTIRGRSGRPLEGIEHTAPLPRGTGGGPLVNAAGEVVGINALRTDPGFLFALSAASVRPAVERLLAGGPEASRLGVAIAHPRIARRLRRAVGLPDRDGLLVREVEKGSASERAGVQVGDLIVGFAGSEIASADDLFGALERAAGTSSGLRVVRGAEELELTVDLGGAAA